MERFADMKSDIIESKNEHIKALVDMEYIKSIKPDSASLNEMIIFQHIYIEHLRYLLRAKQYGRELRLNYQT